MPPVTPSGLKALVTIAETAEGRAEKLAPITTNAVPTYKSAIKGTSFDVTLAMLLIPPMMTRPVSKAKIEPNNHPRLAKNPSLPPVTLTN